MAKRTAAYAVSPKTQKLFIGLIIALIALQCAIIGYWLIRQYPSNHNLSAYLLPAAIGIVGPLVFMATAFWIRHKQAGRRSRVFDAAFFGSIGLLFSSLISGSTVFYQQLYIFNGGYWRSILYSLLPWLAGYIIYVFFLLRYKG